MTYDTINRDRENTGSVSTVYHRIDITSLDDTGTENYDPDDVGISGADRYGIRVTGIEDPSVIAQWNHVAGELNVRNLSDGSQVATGSAVGEVILEVTGV